MLVSLRSHDTCVNRYSGSRGRGRRSAAYLFVDVAPVAAKMESKPGRCYHPLVHRLPPRRLPPFANLLPPPPLQALVFVSRNSGIPRVFPTRKRKVTMSLRKGTTSTWYHTWFLCSYIRESWAYQASFPRYSAQNDRFATVLENREHTLIHEKKNKKSLRLWKWKYRVCFSINIYIYRWYEFFPSLKNKEPCINYRYSEFRFWKF